MAPHGLCHQDSDYRRVPSALYQASHQSRAVSETGLEYTDHITSMEPVCITCAHTKEKEGGRLVAMQVIMLQD